MTIALKTNYLITILLSFVLLQKNLCYPRSTKLIVQNKCVSFESYMESNPLKASHFQAGEAKVFSVHFRFLITKVISVTTLTTNTKKARTGTGN
jgi:hypothetical protein